MAISATGKLNRDANQFQAGDSIGFGVRLGVKFFNRETKSNDYTNYEAVLFARQGPQSDLYTKALVEGAIIELSGSGCQIKTFEGQNGVAITIAILDAKLGYFGYPEASNNSAPQMAPPQAEGQSTAPMSLAELDDDIPF